MATQQSTYAEKTARIKIYEMHLNNFKDIQFEECEIQMKNKLKFTVAFIKSTKFLNTTIIRTYYKNYSKSNGSS